MIKIDELQKNDYQKRLMLAGGLVSVLVTLYTLIFIGLSKILQKFGVRKKMLVAGHAVICLLCLLHITSTEYTLSDFINPYLEYKKNIMLVDPGRILIATVYSGLFLYYGGRIGEGADDWVIEQEIKNRKKLLPNGKFDYADRSHMLLFGATRTGKGVALNHIIKDRLEGSPDELMVIVSAKLASGDKYSQLAYLRKMAEKTRRKLYVVSMDERVKDRCQYNPFRHLNNDEMRNALSCMLDFDSEFYRKNFMQWVMCLYKAIKAGNDTVSIENILRLYSWKSYKRYVRQLLANDKITERVYRLMLDEKIENYATIAQNDSANLDDVVDACRSVFFETPNKKKITITEAFKENALIYFDLNGTSAADSVRMLGGACILQEIQHCMVEFSDPNQRKTVIFDEASYYMNENLVKAFFNVSASMGYQFIISTQGPSDIASSTETLIHQLNNNLGQLGILRVSDPEDVEMLDAIIGTTVTTENTHRVNSIDYDTTGSLKAKDQMIVPHDTIKNLQPLQMIYLQKSRSEYGIARPKLVKWQTEDL